MQKIDDEVAQRQAAEKAAAAEHYKAKATVGVAGAEYKDRDSKWTLAKSTMTEKIQDAEKQALGTPGADMRAAASHARHLHALCRIALWWHCFKREILLVRLSTAGVLCSGLRCDFPVVMC